MWIKICGVKDERTAEQVCALTPDAIGLNFYAKSVRCVSADIAVRIARLMPETVQRVGVFVNQAVSEVEDLVSAGSLHCVQLHGDESSAQIAELCQRLPSVSVLRAWRMAGDELSDLGVHLSECRARRVKLAGCLIDARVAGNYGGTGHTVSWPSLASVYQRDTWPPLILAGGLTPENVAKAIRETSPWGVDVASGVESSAGIKDIERVRRFIEHARGA